MARGSVELGPCPYNEEPIQVNDRKNYLPQMVNQSARYARQLHRMFDMPDGMRFQVKAFPHEMGSYTEVVVVYDDENAEHHNELQIIECNLPAYWDEVAKDELVKFEMCN